MEGEDVVNFLFKTFLTILIVGAVAVIFLLINSRDYSNIVYGDYISNLSFDGNNAIIEFSENVDALDLGDATIVFLTEGQEYSSPAITPNRTLVINIGALGIESPKKISGVELRVSGQPTETLEFTKKESPFVKVYPLQSNKGKKNNSGGGGGGGSSGGGSGGGDTGSGGGDPVVGCSNTCASLGYTCGMQSICGISTNCGTCGENLYCDAGICRAMTPTYTSVISQYGITWYLDKEYRYGQYINGDYWVLAENGQVKITRMTPDFDGGSNGWMVNMESENQGYDNRTNYFNASLVPTLPYTAKPGDSIIKSVSRNISGTCRPCLQTAAILTVVNELPSPNEFRPAFFGKSPKNRYSFDSVNMSLLPSLTPPVGYEPSTFTWLDERFKRLQLDVDSYPGEHIRPYDNYRNILGTGYDASSVYGGRLATDTGDLVLRLMLNDSIESKKQHTIYLVQHGIDLYHTMKGGMDWEPNGGHGSGRKLPMIVAAILLQNDTMKQDILAQEKIQGGVTTFQEDGYIYYSQKANNGNGLVLFGGHESEFNYWYNVVEDGHSRVASDPYQYIDCGHVPGTSYQEGINSMIWKGPVVAMAVWPEVNRLWDHYLFVTYTDRWVSFGTWAQPDPCAPVMGRCVGGSKDGQICTYSTASDGETSIHPEESFCGVGGNCVGGRCESASPFAGQLCSYEVNPGRATGQGVCGYAPNGNYYRCLPDPEFYSKTYGPNPASPGNCILDTDSSDGIGRFPREHGARADEGVYQSAFVNAMWKMYRYRHCSDGIKDFNEEGVDCGGSCVMDKDGDSYKVGYCNSAQNLDCNDNNANINPGKPEICTKTGEFDDNCDGQLHASQYQDSDGDGVSNCEDNCISNANSNQADSDGDGAGDACDGLFNLYEDFEGFTNISQPSPNTGLLFKAVQGNAQISASGCCGESRTSVLSMPGVANGKNIVVIDGGNYPSYTLKIWVGRAYAQGGIISHYQDLNNYYFIDISRDRLEKMVNGVSTVISGTGDSINMEWSRVNSNYTIVANSGSSLTFTVTKDGTSTRTFVDPSPSFNGGTIGFRDEGDSLSQYNYWIFDNINVSISA
jgi:hypothetical protein